MPSQETAKTRAGRLLLPRSRKPRVALVLGSGAARGWAHIGVIHELEEMGIRPDLVVGASVGAIVGGAYCSGNLPEFEAWISSLRRVDIIRLLDACRASIALPGLFAPSRYDPGRLLVDGGVVNPVPVSLARAMGGDVVIAVNLNGDLVGRHFFVHVEEHVSEEDSERELAEIEDRDSGIARWAAKMKASFGVRLDSYISSLRRKESPDPGLFDVIAGAIDIMQDRITRSRMAEGCAATRRERGEIKKLVRGVALHDVPAG